MKRLKKRRALIIVLVSLLLYALVCYSFPLHAGLDYQAGASNAGLPKKLPITDGEDQSLPVPLWQSNQNDILFPQIIVKTNHYRVNLKAAGSSHNIPYFYHHGIGARNPGVFFYFIGTPNVILRFTSYQAYQYLDLPPPGYSARV